jgi:hypothetical protein
VLLFTVQVGANCMGFLIQTLNLVGLQSYIPQDCNHGDCIGGFQFRPRPKLKIQSWGQREESRKEVAEGSGSSLLRKLTGRACAGICRGPYG